MRKYTMNIEEIYLRIKCGANSIEHIQWLYMSLLNFCQMGHSHMVSWGRKGNKNVRKNKRRDEIHVEFTQWKLLFLMSHKCNK